MLRTTTLILCLLGAMGTVSAQHARFGLKAGLNASTCSRVSKPDYRVGATAGIFLRQPLSAHLALQPELLYEQRGVRLTQEGSLGWEGSGGYFVHQEGSRFHYLSMPVLMRGQVGKFFALAGPQLSFLAAARRRTTTEYVLPYDNGIVLPYPPSESIGSMASYQRWELGYVVGAGYAVSPRLAVEIRYAAGLTNLHKPYEALAYPDLRWPDVLGQARNRSWQAQMSYQLGAL
ncbi:MAG: PorT family protein [Hymenobacter sp.]|nr:PorT family protein [Hymenobacter sp.]